MFEDRTITRRTVTEAVDRAKKAGRFTAMTLADPGLVGRVHGDLSAFLRDKIDIVFANEEEAKTLTGKPDALEAAKAVREFGLWGAVTMSERGSYVFGPEGEIEKIEAMPPSALVDTTGAGDAYAAGWLHAFTTGRSIAECGKLGSLAASEVISHTGARPEVSLKELARKRGLLG
jgi:sugar/nucleoside kinase (ribokinase family)